MATVIYGGFTGNDELGSLGDDGTIYDRSGSAVGKIASDGWIYAQPITNNVVGKVDSDGGTYDDPCGGNYLGYTCDDGRVFDSRNDVVAHVEGSDVRRAGAAALAVLLR